MSYARARYGGGTTKFGVASPSCCEDCKCGESCSGCPSYTRAQRFLPFGDVRAESAREIFGAGVGDLKETLTTPSIKTAAGLALTYHGYKRTGSILWALAYGLAGKTVPLVAVPLAVAQGFGKRKEGCP